MSTTDSALDPAALARHYQAFRVSERILLTGHSHQAWPDVGREGMMRAWEDAAALADDKWDRAFEVAGRVREGFRGLLDDPSGSIALGQNTFDLVARLLSALPLGSRPRLVTTDGEFHTIRRLLARLEEEGLEVVRVPSSRADRIAEMLAAEVDDGTAAVLVSAVLFQNAHIVPGLGHVARACAKVGAELLVDVYHTLDAMPFSLVDAQLEGAYVVGGGYKYCQLGEGNCFIRLPEYCELRPVLTGWFAEFGALAESHGGGEVQYAPAAGRFAGATYDPVSHYRAAAVFDFFEVQGLTPPALRTLSQHQLGRLVRGIEDLDPDPAVLRLDDSVPLTSVGGFLALESPAASDMTRHLKEAGVHTDHRGTTLRLGPAPYVTDAQLDEAVVCLGRVVSRLATLQAGRVDGISDGP